MTSTESSRQSKVMTGKQHKGKTTAAPRAVTQKIKKAEKEFTDRLREIINTQKKTWWREKLGVSQSLIGSRWE
jgi:exonuclease III